MPSTHFLCNWWLSLQLLLGVRDPVMVPGAASFLSCDHQSLLHLCRATCLVVLWMAASKCGPLVRPLSLTLSLKPHQITVIHRRLMLARCAKLQSHPISMSHPMHHCCEQHDPCACFRVVLGVSVQPQKATTHHRICLLHQALCFWTSTQVDCTQRLRLKVCSIVGRLYFHLACLASDAERGIRRSSSNVRHLRLKAISSRPHITRTRKHHTHAWLA